ncbi:hypothetical protein B0T10DRAFT_588182 [Thelonectria olida]|uniref:Uncharacterized protein n=1 Tax=Thelonectria olida TaxID=1576542 RepID=A0A9P8VR02_9HYPO|nr:hypothetical protein B0T10DRAFT_588182 [Thelonectria olida]
MSTPRSTHWLPSTLPLLGYMRVKESSTTGKLLETTCKLPRLYADKGQAIMFNVFGSFAAEVDSVTATLWQSWLISSAKAGNLTVLNMLERMALDTAKEIRLLEEKKQLEAIGIDLDKWNTPPKTPDNSTTLDPNVQTLLAAIVQDQLHLYLTNY